MTIAKHDTHIHNHKHKHENITNNNYEYHTHIYEYTSLTERIMERLRKYLRREKWR